MREEAILKIRPLIPAIQNGRETNEAEEFQNKTLRPILKMQNELLLAVFHNYVEKRKGVFHGLSNEKKRDYIEQSVQRDLKFRNFLFGLIAGHFTLEEWARFEKNPAELTRRAMTMFVQRLHGQLV